MSRVYKENIEIDMQKAQCFFENRFSKEDPASSVMLRGKADNVALKRDENEALRIKKFVDFTQPQHILDLGCGYGRLAMHFKEILSSYDGIDSSKTYINAANELFQEYGNINFHLMLANKLDKKLLQKSYNLIFLTGLSIYLNDNVLIELLEEIPTFCTKNTKFYIRESVSVIGERLTLKDFYSDELNAEYSAIYRPSEEYEALFAKYLPHSKIISSDLILDDTTGARKETNQRYWLLQM